MTVNFPLQSLAYWGFARALLHSSDPAKARDAYVNFFELWKDADSNLAPLKQARIEARSLFEK